MSDRVTRSRAAALLTPQPGTCQACPSRHGCAIARVEEGGSTARDVTKPAAESPSSLASRPKTSRIILGRIQPRLRLLVETRYRLLYFLRSRSRPTSPPAFPALVSHGAASARSEGDYGSYRIRGSSTAAAIFFCLLGFARLGFALEADHRGVLFFFCALTAKRGCRPRRDRCRYPRPSHHCYHCSLWQEEEHCWQDDRRGKLARPARVASFPASRAVANRASATTAQDQDRHRAAQHVSGTDGIYRRGNISCQGRVGGLTGSNSDKPAVNEGFPMKEWTVEIYILDQDGKEKPARCFHKVTYNLHPSFANPIQSK